MMTEKTTVDMELIRARLSGANLKKFLSERRLTKYRLSKDTGIPERTFRNWASGKTRPSSSLAIRVGRYLGMISPSDEEIIDIRTQISALTEKLDRLTAGSRPERRTKALPEGERAEVE